MKTLLSLLILLVGLLAAPSAYACDEGDSQEGPNCVHLEWIRYGVLKQPYTTVYRGDDWKSNVVWDDFGTLVRSTLEKIEILDIFGENQEYSWSAKKGKYE